LTPNEFVELSSEDAGLLATVVALEATRLKRSRPWRRRSGNGWSAARMFTASASTETIAAMKAARRGELTNFGRPDALLASLNAGD
jgi:hypothetical protein